MCHTGGLLRRAVSMGVQLDTYGLEARFWITSELRTIHELGLVLWSEGGFTIPIPRAFPNEERQSRCATSQITFRESTFPPRYGFVGFREYPAGDRKNHIILNSVFRSSLPEVTQSRLEAIEIHLDRKS